jgi:hypothetical protein
MGAFFTACPTLKVTGAYAQSCVAFKTETRPETSTAETETRPRCTKIFPRQDRDRDVPYPRRDRDVVKVYTEVVIYRGGRAAGYSPRPGLVPPGGPAPVGPRACLPVGGGRAAF